MDHPQPPRGKRNLPIGRLSTGQSISLPPRHRQLVEKHATALGVNLSGAVQRMIEFYEKHHDQVVIKSPPMASVGQG